MASDTDLTFNSFVRKLPEWTRDHLSVMLDPYDTWEKLAAQIPADHNKLLSSQDTRFQARYATYNFMAFRNGRGSPTKKLLEDWGLENCQIKHLIKALQNANLIEASNFVKDICCDSQPREAIVVGDGGNVGELDQSGCVKKLSPVIIEDKPVVKEKMLGSGDNGDLPSRLEDLDLSPDIQGVSKISFAMLSFITGCFDERPVTEGGRVIGMGGFGHVFLGEYMSSNGCSQRQRVAVKRLKDSSELSRKQESLKQFKTEVETLCTYKHKHLVTLLGYSSDGALPCLVYEYMVNGSLEDRLACMYGSPPLSVVQRLQIAKGTALAMEYLHGEGITHRDIKTANILLDADLMPKVGDFATARIVQKSVDKTTRMGQTNNIIGTQAYLAPEAFEGIFHPGLDIFSFGVVILEIITGLPVDDENREFKDIKIFVREHCTSCVNDGDSSDDDDDDAGDEETSGSIHDLVDRKAPGGWPSWLVEDLYKLATQCLEPSMRMRKKIRHVLDKLDCLEAGVVK